MKTSFTLCFTVSYFDPGQEMLGNGPHELGQESHVLGSGPHVLL